MVAFIVPRPALRLKPRPAAVYSRASAPGEDQRVSLLDYWHIMEPYLDRHLHRALDDLTDEQWHAIPTGAGNSIAFIAWHYMRTEDNIIHWIIQERTPTVWMQGGWSERLGLPRVSQGTGMPFAEAQALRIADTAGF